MSRDIVCVCVCVCEQLIIRCICYISTCFGSYDHHEVKYLHSLCTFLQFSPTLANVYIWGRSYALFANVNANV
jgi:hypothetical protein